MALDYNPDKERWTKHKHIVMNATRQKMDGVEVGGKKLKFGPDGWLRVSDPGQAEEIRQRYGQQVTVTRMRNPDPADRGHTYVFTSPGMPWHRYDELGRRIKDGE
jgi:hypothetical protein